MTRRSRMAEKIAALRAKTTAAGCTEAEALAAAELAARLMQEHGLSEEELRVTEASTFEPTSRPTWRTGLTTIIAYCTNTHATQIHDDRYVGMIVVFIGRDPGPEIAVYLRDVCFRAVETELARFKATTFYRRRRTVKTRRQAAGDFADGMAMRLQVRLLELFEPVRDDAARAEAKAVSKGRFAGAVAAKLQQRDTRYSAAADAGWVAGGNVALNRGVGGDRKMAAIAAPADPAITDP